MFTDKQCTKNLNLQSGFENNACPLARGKLKSPRQVIFWLRLRDRQVNKIQRMKQATSNKIFKERELPLCYSAIK